MQKKNKQKTTIYFREFILGHPLTWENTIVARESLGSSCMRLNICCLYHSPQEHHKHEISEEIQKIFGSGDCCVLKYFNKCFPTFFMETFQSLRSVDEAAVSRDLKKSAGDLET